MLVEGAIRSVVKRDNSKNNEGNNPYNGCASTSCDSPHTLKGERDDEEAMCGDG